MRPLTLLALVATATSSVATPLPAAVEHVVQKIAGGHRRSESVVLDLAAEGLKKQHDLLEVEAQAKHHGKHHRSIAVGEAAAVVAEVKQPSRSRVHNRRDVVDILPSKAPSSNAGLVDVYGGVGDAHLVQTPGKDKTIVDVFPGPVDAKINLPTEGPFDDDVDGAPKGASDMYDGIGKNLAGKKHGPLDGVIDDGKGGPQGLEVDLGSDDKQHKSSSAHVSKSHSHPSARPTSSAAHRSSASHASASHSASHSASAHGDSSSARPTSSAPHAPPRSSASSASRASHHPTSSASRASHHPASSSAHASHSHSASSAHPTQSGNDSGFQLLPGAFAAARESGKMHPGRIINPSDPHDAKPGQPHGGITVDPGHKAIGSTLGQKPSSPKDHTTPARVEFGHLPKNTMPCDGVNVRDKGEVVEVCIELALLDQRPKGYDACPEYPMYDITTHENSKDITNKVDKDIAKVVKLCVGAGVL